MAGHMDVLPERYYNSQWWKPAWNPEPPPFLFYNATFRNAIRTLIGRKGILYWSYASVARWPFHLTENPEYKGAGPIVFVLDTSRIKNEKGLRLTRNEYCVPSQKAEWRVGKYTSAKEEGVPLSSVVMVALRPDHGLAKNQLKELREMCKDAGFNLLKFDWKTFWVNGPIGAKRKRAY